VADDLDVREALAEALRDEGYRVECAVDGEQALDGRMEERARALETDGAIKKPIDLDKLLEVIRRFNVSKTPA